MDLLFHHQSLTKILVSLSQMIFPAPLTITILLLGPTNRPAEVYRLQIQLHFLKETAVQDLFEVTASFWSSCLETLPG